MHFPPWEVPAIETSYSLTTFLFQADPTPSAERQRRRGFSVRCHGTYPGREKSQSENPRRRCAFGSDYVTAVRQ